MAEVFRPAYPSTGSGKTRHSSFGTRRNRRPGGFRYYTPDGKRHKVKGYRDKKATESHGRRAGTQGGIAWTPASSIPLDDHAKRPLAEHAGDYRRYLAGEGEYAGARSA